MSSRHNVQDASGVIERVPPQGTVQAYGSTVPTDATAGYAIGCIFHKLNGGAATALYINEGTANSCAFKAVNTAGSLAGTGGAGLVGILDSGNFTAQTTVEAALAEIYQDRLTAQGFVEVPLTHFRALTTGEMAAKGAIDGGILSLDTSPLYKRINGATDKNLRITWAAASVVEIAAPVVIPPDMDVTAACTVNLRCKMAGAADTPTIAIDVWSGIGGSNLGGTTAALSNAIATKSVTVAANGIAVHPNTISISLVVGAHNTDVCELYSCYILYKRKLLTS